MKILHGENLKRLAILGLATATLGGGYTFVRKVLAQDPFSALRKKENALGKEVGMRLEDVNMKVYKDGKLTTQADIDRVDVREDRQFLDLYGLNNGLLFDGSDAYEFEAKRAMWHASRQVMQVLSGGSLKGEDIDLQVPAFNFDQSRSVLDIPGKLAGRLLKGEIMAASLRYNLETKSGVAGPMEWTGPATIAFGQGEAPVDVGRSWTVSAPNGDTRIKGDLAISVGGVTATDGEIIVLADRVEHDRKTGVLVATGRVRYFATDANLECPKATIYRKERRAVLTGGVTMLVKPEEGQGPAKVEDLPAFRSYKPDELKVAPPAKRTPEEKKLDEELRSSETARKYPVALRAAEIEYFYKKGERRAIITGRPEAHQALTAGRWRHVWTHHAAYDGEKDRLTLFSSEGNFDTQVKSSLGDDLVAKLVELSTKKGDDELYAKQPRGDIFDDDEDLKTATQKKDGDGTPKKGVDEIGT